MTEHDLAAIERDLEKRVQRIIASNKTIKRRAELYFDLQIAGDDARELLERIANDYGVRFGDFKFSDYFPNETEALWCYWKSLIGFRDHERRSFTLDHLIAVVERGEWFERCG